MAGVYKRKANIVKKEITLTIVFKEVEEIPLTETLKDIKANLMAGGWTNIRIVSEKVKNENKT